MNGRFLGAKKSIILRVTAIIMFFLFIALTLLCVLLFKIPELWFFSFCFCISIYQIEKGFLFNIDNSHYIGVLLLTISITGYLAYFLKATLYLAVLIPACFCAASLSTYFKFKQKFHLILAFSISFVNLYGFLLLKKMITFEIFIAFTTTFLVLFILAMLSSIKWRK